MYYIQYLASLCRRRHWNDPLYDFRQYGNGFICIVRVNHREYQAEGIHETEGLAREAAAMRAYLMCRNFSVNEGMHSGSNNTATGPITVSPPNGNAGHAVGTVANRAFFAAHGSGAGNGVGNGYSTGVMPGHSGMAVGNAGNGRMGNPQGVIVVGHSQVGI
ncbi:CAAX farnesyltransferase (FTase) subunit beta [Rhizina undulata]